MSKTRVIESSAGRGFPAPDKANFSLDGPRGEDEVPKASASSSDNKTSPIGAFAPDERHPKRKLSGLKTTGIGTGFNANDYGQKYPDDPHGEEAGPDARVWKIYMDESDSYLKERIESWKDTIDIHLVFAGLFSVVLTGFVVQASGKMQPDYTQISALFLQELIIIQRAGTDGGQSSSGLPIVQSRSSHAQSDTWMNGLWFTSLSLSLMCVVLAMLAKQWLHHFTSFVPGTPQDRVRVRHYHITGIETWHVPELINSLPVLMNIAVLLFLVGLIIFLAHLNIAVAIAAGAVSVATFSIYFTSIMLPLKYILCPYKSPMTTCVQYLYVKGVHPLLHWLCYPLHRRKYYIAPWLLEKLEWMEFHDRSYDIKALQWLYRTSDSTVKHIILQSICGLDPSYHPDILEIGRNQLENHVEMAVLSCLKDNTVIPSMESKLGRLLRTFLRVKENASLLTLPLQNIDFSEVTDPHLRAFFEVYHAIEPTNSHDPHRRLNLILDYLSDTKRNVYQLPSIWEELLNIDLPNIPDQLHFTVVTEILGQLNGTRIFEEIEHFHCSVLSFTSLSSLPNILRNVPEQGILYLTRIFVDRKIPSSSLIHQIPVTGPELLKSIMKWALMAPTSPGFKPLLQEIMISLEDSAPTTCLVVPVLLESDHFMDIEIVDRHTREAMIKLLHSACLHLTRYDYPMPFYTNLLRLIKVDSNLQDHSISKHILPIFGSLPLPMLFDAIQKEDGLSFIGRLEISDELVEFFKYYVSQMTWRLVKEEFWMDYAHRPENLFLICCYIIISGRDDLLLSFAQINPTAEGWHQCMQELIQFVRSQESFNSLANSRFEFRISVSLPQEKEKVLDAISNLNATLKLSSPEYDIPVDIIEAEQDTHRERDDIDNSSFQRYSTDDSSVRLYLLNYDHSGIPMDDSQPPSHHRRHFGETLWAFLSSRQRDEDHERSAV